MNKSVQVTKSFRNKYSNYDTLKSLIFVSEHFNWKKITLAIFLALFFLRAKGDEGWDIAKLQGI